jgi:pheromone shutdown protein TraB
VAVPETAPCVLVIGSAHVVDLRADLRRLLAERRLDAVALELDRERAEVLLSPNPVVRGGRGDAPFLLSLWARLQRRLGQQLGGGPPGAEMRAVAEIAQERGLPILLIDDPIRETLARLLRSLSMKERIGLLFGGILGLVIPARVVEKHLDEYTEAPEPYLEQIRTAYPAVARVLLDERNEHMADRLAEAHRHGLTRVAAVVGDAHVPGLSEALRRRQIPVETVSLGQLTRPTGP